MPKEPSDTPRLIQDIARLDEQLITLLARRARLLKDALRQPQDGPRKGRDMDPGLEKSLWKSWEAAIPPSKRDTRLWRTLFTLVQELPAADADLADEQDGPQGFALTPRPGMTDIKAQGPAAHLDACCHLALAAQSGEPVTLSGVVLNDPLVALIKGLNQAGAALHWDDSCAMSRGGADLSFAGKVLHAGDSPLALNILMALALADPGRTRFAGGPALKLLDISPLTALFPKLGARLSQVIPGSPGLPARMEASAVFPEFLHLPPDTPEDTALALALAAPSFESGLALRWDEAAQGTLAPAFASLMPIFEQWSIRADLAPGSLRMEPGRPVPPKEPRMDLDPLLGGWLLALPLFVGKGKPGTSGDKAPRCRVEGAWPRERHPWDALAALLAESGLALNIDPDGVTSTLPANARAKDGVLLDTARIPAYFPLAVVLGAALARKGAAVRITSPASQGQQDICDEFLERLGLDAKERGELLLLERAAHEPEMQALAPWLSPDPAWTLAYALAGFLRPGLTLANPGGVTELMPGFWALYNGLPEPPRIQARPRSAKKEKDDGQRRPKGRRIRL